jgi:hypothetical protein
MDLLALKRSLMPMSGPQDSGGGGGGGSAPANTTSATTATQDLPEWAKPYAQDVLSKGKAVTDVSQNPYQAYGGERVAGFSDLQKQSQTGAGNIQTGPQGFQQDVGGYMNPYMNQIMAPRLAEANRQYDISGMQANTQATQAGAFGGGRQALMQAENERNRNTGLNQIYGQGLDTAFSNAQNQYNQGFGQNIQAIGLQNQMGAQQQAQTQKGLDVAQQDFLTQKNYPYQQLSYMANLVRGTPMGMNQQSQVYQAPPSTAQNLTALGLGAAGVSKLFADGGEVKTYAGDKSSVTSSDNVEEIISTLNPEQLQNALRNAQARGDDRTVVAIMERLDSLSREASMNKGIAGAMPEQMADGIVNAAGGGILAFNKRGLVDESDGEGTDIASLIGNQRVIDPALQKKASERVYGLSEALIDRAGYAPKPEDRAKFEKEYIASLTKDLGPDPYAPQQAYLDKKAANQGQLRSRAEGAALLQAIPLVLQGSNAMRGIGAGAGKLGASMGEIEQAQQVAEDHMVQARFNLASLQRNEKMGLRKEARADYASLQQNLIAADKNDILGKTNAANILNNVLRSNIVRTGAGAGGAGKKDKLAEQLAAAEIAFEKDPSDENTKIVTALRRAQAQNKTTDVGKTKADLTREQIAAGETKEVRNAMKSFAFTPDYMEARQADPERADALWNAEIERQRNMDPNRTTPSPGRVGGSGGSGNAPPLPPGFNRQ